MKKECEIVQDLLFGYTDGTLKNASKELVEEHIKSCNNCKMVLKELQEDSNVGATEQEVDYLKGINRKINKKSIIIIITTILLIILSILHIIVYVNYKEYVDSTCAYIYLKKDVTEEEKSNIEKTIREVADNFELEYISSQKALENLKVQFAENANLLDGYNDENVEETFPKSYVVRTDFKSIKQIKEKIKGMPGVEHVSGDEPVNPYALTYFNLFYK